MLDEKMGILNKRHESALSSNVNLVLENFLFPTWQSLGFLILVSCFLCTGTQLDASVVQSQGNSDISRKLGKKAKSKLQVTGTRSKKGTATIGTGQVTKKQKPVVSGVRQVAKRHGSEPKKYQANKLTRAGRNLSATGAPVKKVEKAQPAGLPRRTGQPNLSTPVDQPGIFAFFGRILAPLTSKLNLNFSFFQNLNGNRNGASQPGGMPLLAEQQMVQRINRMQEFLARQSLNSQMRQNFLREIKDMQQIVAVQPMNPQQQQEIVNQMQQIQQMLETQPPGNNQQQIIAEMEEAQQMIEKPPAVVNPIATPTEDLAQINADINAGKLLYDDACLACHSTGVAKPIVGKGKSLADINTAIATQPIMNQPKIKSLTDTQRRQIAMYLSPPAPPIAAAPPAVAAPQRDVAMQNPVVADQGTLAQPVVTMQPQPPTTTVLTQPPKTDPPPDKILNADEEIALGVRVYQEKQCAQCHGPLETSTRRGTTTEDKLRVALKSQAGMTTLALSDQEIRAVVAALKVDPAKELAMCQQAADVGHVPLQRLGTTEYNATIADLLGVTNVVLPLSFPKDNKTEEGFDNFAGINFVTKDHIVEYYGTANAALNQVWARKELLGRWVNCNLTDANCAKNVITAFLERAFRRPPTTAEINARVAQHQDAIKGGHSADMGLKAVFLGILISPKFIYRSVALNNPDDPKSTTQLSQYELATRLSYFLWSSAPDAELLNAAKSGKLANAVELELQVKRMLKDPRSKALIANFLMKWFGIYRLQDHGLSAALSPAMPPTLRAELIKESELFLSDLISRNAKLSEILTSEQTFLNDSVAKHYGIGGVVGKDFRAYSLANSPRIGILGHSSILTSTSNAMDSSLAKRGKFVLSNLLCSPPPPPPPGTPGLPPAKNPNETVRQRFERHRAEPQCAACHAGIDPIGIALENFDGIGRFRTSYFNGTKVDSAGQLPDGRKVSSARELAAVVAQDPKFARCLALKSVAYGLGRVLKEDENCLINRLGRIALDRPLSEFLMAFFQSNIFQKMRAAD